MPIHSWHWGTEKAFSCLRVATIQKTFPGLITVKLNRWFTASERWWEMFVTYSLLKQEHLEIKYFKTMHWCFLTEKTFAFKNKFSQLHSFLFFLGRTFFFCLLKIVILSDFSFSCPCSCTTCRHEWRNDWNSGIATGRCTQQRRNSHHITQSHGGKGSI